MKLNKVRCEVSSFLKVPLLEGELIMTNYKLIFKYLPPADKVNNGKTSSKDLPAFLEEYLKIPLTCIHRLDKTINQDKKTVKPSYIEIITKDFRQIKFVLDSVDECNNCHMRIQLMAFPENEFHDVFAF